MKELGIASFIIIGVLFLAPFIGTIISYILLFGLFFAIGYFLTKSAIQFGKNLSIHKQDRAGRRA